jgi:hypothetical protein
MYAVMERHFRGGCGWSTSPGLEEIPAELHDQAAEAVRRHNMRIGWTMYQLVPTGLPYQVCLGGEG